MKQAHIFVSGFVQGVGYRQFVKLSARGIGVVGWVRNLPDGRVEAVLQGSHSASSGQAQEKIDQLIALCKKGPFLSEVEDVQVVWEESTEEHKDFNVVTG